MKKLISATIVACSLVIPTSIAGASAGSKCTKVGRVNAATGLKCVNRKGQRVWEQFYAVPGRLSFIAFSAVTGNLTLGDPATWGNPAATSFVIQLRSTAAPDWVTIAETAIGNRSLTLSNITPGVGYEVRVAARNSYGIGEFLNSGLSYSATSATTTTTTTLARTTSTTSTTSTTVSSVTAGQTQASRSAASYLRAMGFSRSGLIKQLQYEGFSLSDATYGVDAQNANWSAQATRVGASYLRSSSFSRTALIRQLEYEGFSYSDSVYGTDAQNADWFSQAAKVAASYLRSSSFSRSGLINQLLFEGFTQAQAEYGANSVGL
jgi:hypothetical protein